MLFLITVEVSNLYVNLNGHFKLFQNGIGEKFIWKFKSIFCNFGKGKDGYFIYKFTLGYFHNNIFGLI
jgi:hypothetical protein